MLSTIIEKAKTIFISDKERNIIEDTKTKHQESEKIMYRSLNEISSKYYVSGVYSMTEVYESEDSDKIKYYEFQLLDDKESTIIKTGFYGNEGRLILIDEEEKEKINKRIRFKPDFERFNPEKSNLKVAPDFLYENNGQSYWITIQAIRTTEEEQQHTKMLDILYRALYNANEIDIDTNFEIYGITTKEKYHDLVHFRLDRNSLFLVVKDRENAVYHSHEFKHIREIRNSDVGDRIKFWLYMFDGTYRFYIPYDKEALIGEHVHVDPIIYKY